MLPPKQTNQPNLLGMSMFYFPLHDFFFFLENFTFKESGLANRAANRSKNKIQYLDSQNSQNQMEMSGCQPIVSCSHQFHITGNNLELISVGKFQF